MAIYTVPQVNLIIFSLRLRMIGAHGSWERGEAMPHSSIAAPLQKVIFST